MAASWPWLVPEACQCSERAMPGVFIHGATAAAGSGLGRSSPRLSGIVPDIRSASCVSFRILDLRQADLGEQGRPLAPMLTIVRRPLDQLGDGGQRVVPEAGLGVDERKTLATC